MKVEFVEFAMIASIVTLQTTAHTDNTLMPTTIAILYIANTIMTTHDVIMTTHMTQ